MRYHVPRMSPYKTKFPVTRLPTWGCGRCRASQQTIKKWVTDLSLSKTDIMV